MTKFSSEQKNILNHFIINTLCNIETARLLKKIKFNNSDEIVVSKKDINTILNNLKKIRTFILLLPKEEN